MDPTLHAPDLAADRLEPLADRPVVSCRRCSRSLAGQIVRGRIDKIDPAIWDGRLERPHARACHAAVTKVKRLQFFQRLETGETGVRDPAAV